MRSVRGLKGEWALNSPWNKSAAYLFIVLLLLPVVFAQSDWFQAGFVKAELNVSSTIDLLSKGPNPFVESLKADVVFVPQNSDFVAVRKFDANAVVTADRVRFEWKNPAIGPLSYKYSAVVETVNDVPRVRAKIPYPLKFPENVQKYVLPTKNIDSNNPNVLGQAVLLAQNEDDLFMLVSKVGLWVKSNVDYNLSTLTSDVSQPASWVLQNKQGVCDEITSLFIAMMRSLKIPARFVSGVAFSNSPQFPLGWGPHGWAEVYFPGVGWVPFDITFGEFGWADPGHIKLKESLDPQEPTTVFEWKAKDVDVKVKDLVLSVGLLETSGSVPSELKFAVSPLRSRVGFGSFNGAVLDVENLADYYVGGTFALARVNELALLSDESQSIVLPPRSRGRLFWKFSVAGSLDPKFQYEIPLQAYDLRNVSDKPAFSIGAWDVVFSLSDVDASIAKLAERQKDLLDLSCVFENDFVWSDSAKLNCVVENRAEVSAPVTVCFKECQDVSIPAKTILPLTFTVPVEAPGPHESEVNAKSGSVAKKAVLTVVRLDAPQVVIADVKVPEVVSYGDSFALRFMLSRESVSFPQNVSVLVKGGGASAVVDVGELVVDQEIVVNIRSDQLFSSNPLFDIDVSYKDPFGKEFAVRSSASLKVSGMPWYKRVVGWFVDLF